MTSPQIQAIRDRYKSSFPEKLAVIADLVEALKESRVNAMDDAHGVLHKLAGSSGMYGYDDIAVLCRDAMVNAQRQNRDELLKKLAELIELLKEHS
mgnify:CR=1 FL=1